MCLSVCVCECVCVCLHLRVCMCVYLCSERFHSAVGLNKAPLGQMPFRGNPKST